MAAIRHLRNAPITEALIDFRAKLPAGFRPEGFRPAAEKLRQQLPIVEEMRSMEAVLEVKQGAISTSETSRSELRGYIFRSADGVNIAQFRTDGFTFNRLKPYTSWEEVFPRAFDLWGVYGEIASPEVVTRVAARYINHIRIPGQRFDFDDYLTAGPEVPAELPQGIGSFLIRLLIHGPEPDLAANVTQALEPPVDPRFTTVILDIDAFKMREWKPTDPDLTETFRVLREFKNRVFFSHITETTARLFE